MLARETPQLIPTRKFRINEPPSSSATRGGFAGFCGVVREVFCSLAEVLSEDCRTWRLLRGASTMSEYHL